MTLQEFFLRRSLIDIQYKVINCDHINAKNYVDGREYPLLFPKSLINLCKSLRSEKTIEYYFKGVVTKKRKWIKNFKKATIIHSERGRGDDKFNYDIEYYADLNKTQFALCPVGECNWSYRLFEAVLCMAIPIVEENDIFHNEFYHYHKGEKMVYRKDWADHNFRTLIKKFTL